MWLDWGLGSFSWVWEGLVRERGEGISHSGSLEEQALSSHEERLGRQLCTGSGF